MAQIFIFTGPFSAGKTEMANEFRSQLGDKIKFSDVSDGEHLVDIVTKDVHGLDGNEASYSHFHEWNATTPRIPHCHSQGEKHFPFTVLHEWVGPEMFRRVVRQMEKAVLKDRSIVVELGTGVNGCQFSEANFSTVAFLEELKKSKQVQKILENIACVVGVDTNWENRRARNLGRPETSDGVTESWGMQEEGLRITYETDFQAWQQDEEIRELMHDRGINLLTYGNDCDGIERMRSFVERFVMPRVQGSEGQQVTKERYY